ncbi:MAG: acyl-CoA dehydrogenase family protein [Deltaproteobacteria bacterium]|nr:acyl-CoA dehydrogenase family protein [Deltaproteobacteria bacterium]
MDFHFTAGELALKKQYDDFFREEMKHAPPVVCKGGYEVPYSKEAYQFNRYIRKKLVEKGWYVQGWPKEYGGRDASLAEQMIFNESVAYFGIPIDSIAVKMFGPAVMLYGTDEQKKRLLLPIAKGEVQYCQGWTEPNAGSDLASLKTTAIKDGEYYVINGQKIWITAAHIADHMFLLARTNPAEKRSRGLSVFNVDLSLPGIEIRPIKYMNGSHVYNEVFFADCRIHESERIGQENYGWEQTRETMNFERSGSGIERFAGIRRYFEQILGYVKTTKRNGKYLWEDPLVRQKIGKIYAEMETGRALAYKNAWLQQVGNLRFSPAAASELKVYGTELIQRLSNFSLEIMGFQGNIEESQWSPLNGIMIDNYQSIIGSIICAGSNEIQRNIIAWVGCGLPRLKGQ